MAADFSDLGVAEIDLEPPVARANNIGDVLAALSGIAKHFVEDAFGRSRDMPSGIDESAGRDPARAVDQHVLHDLTQQRFLLCELFGRMIARFVVPLQRYLARARPADLVSWSSPLNGHGTEDFR